MALSKKEINHAYSPYRKEAIFCFIIDCVIVVASMAFLICIDAIQLFYVFPLYFVVEVLLNYRLAILCAIEERYRKFDLLEIKFTKSDLEDSASGHWGSIIPQLYPSELRVARYRIKCIDSNNKSLTLRCVMSLKNAELFDKMIECNTEQMQLVIVGKYSRIIVKYCTINDFTFVLNRRL